MRFKYSYALICGIVLLALAACNSLLSETERIRKQYAFNNGSAPVVVSTDPADSSIAPYNQTYIDITFSTEVDAGTVTPQSAFGTCTGSVQVSYDGFTNCLGGTLDASQNPRLRFTPTIFPKALGLQIKVTNTVLSSVGVAAVPYTSAGFKLGAPCGNQNCYFSYATPLMTNAGASSQIFPIRSGTDAGKYLILTAGSTTTTILDPIAVTTTAGPTLPAGCSPGDGGHNFYIATGAVNKGKQAIIKGGATQNWCLYDPIGQSITLSGVPLPVASAGSGGLSLQPTSAASVEVDNTLVLRGFTTNGILRYSPATESFTDVSATYVISGSIGSGAHALKLQTGINIGKWLIMNGAPAPSNGTWLFTESPAGFVTSTATAGAMGGGAASFETGSGASGKVITVLGGNSTAVSVLDTNTFAAPALQNSALAAGVSSAALLLQQSGSAPLLLHGGVTNPHMTSLYNAGSSSFVTGPVTTGAILDGSAQTFIAGGSGGGAFFIVNGNGLPSTSVYFPSSNLFSRTRMPTSVPNGGAHAFYNNITGRTVIVGGAGTIETALFDPIRFEMLRGPQLPSAATATSFSVPITRGPNAGKVLVFPGGTATYFVYDPATNQFSTSASLGWPVFSNPFDTGASGFSIANDDRMIIIRGGGSLQADVFDISTAIPTLGAAISIGCSVSVAPLSVRYTTTPGLVKQFVYCNGTQVAIFDHASATFSGPFSVLATAGGVGMQGFVAPSGPDAGKIVVIPGGGLTSSSVHDPNNIATVVSGPALGGCAAGTGSQLFSMMSGIHTGKTLLIAGNTTSNSCFFNTATNTVATSLVAGPAMNSSASTAYQIDNGAVAFRTNGGLYPTSIIVLSGANKNVWGTYVP